MFSSNAGLDCCQFKDRGMTSWPCGVHFNVETRYVVVFSGDRCTDGSCTVPTL